MLSAPHRLRRSAQFSQVVRRGSRARAGSLVIHQLPGLVPSGPALVGLIVGKNVGGSVRRHRVSRRLRAQLSERIELLPEASGTVVRALPGAAESTSAQLGDDLDRALARVGTATTRTGSR